MTRSLRKADVCVGCHSPREGEEEGGAVSVTEAWILGMSHIPCLFPIPLLMIIPIIAPYIYNARYHVNPYIRASVDALCRDGTSEISRDPRTKRLQTRRESLAMPSKHTNNNF